MAPIGNRWSETDRPMVCCTNVASHAVGRGHVDILCGLAQEPTGRVEQGGLLGGLPLVSRVVVRSSRPRGNTNGY